MLNIYSHSKGSTPIRTTADSVLLTWDFRSEFNDYKGKYFVVIRSMFDEYLQLIETDKGELVLNFIPFRMEKAVLYQVISEDCVQVI